MSEFRALFHHLLCKRCESLCSCLRTTKNISISAKIVCLSLPLLESYPLVGTSGQYIRRQYILSNLGNSGGVLESTKPRSKGGKNSQNRSRLLVVARATIAELGMRLVWNARISMSSASGKLDRKPVRSSLVTELSMFSVLPLDISKWRSLCSLPMARISSRSSLFSSR
jgi:hypothetical protein